jgi:tRNA pseudouridine55 synthase
MKNFLLLNKKEGETPLFALDNFRQKNPEYKNTKMTYAGRLDPMASGLLIILAGDETKNKEKYLALEKEYEFEVLLGVSTDTHDILGKITSISRQGLAKKELEKEIKNQIKSFLGKTTQKYPMYSSKTVKGKPLFNYARAGRKIAVPEKEIFIKKLKLEKIKEINGKILLKNIQKRIRKVTGDFRQAEILKLWQKELPSLLNKNKNKLPIASFKIRCSSGTYVRGIAHALGQKIKTGALAYSIKRIKIGKYVL